MKGRKYQIKRYNYIPVIESLLERDILIMDYVLEVWVVQSFLRKVE